MTRGSLVNIIRQLLKTAEPLDFLLHVDDDDLRTLITCIRDSKDFDSEPQLSAASAHGSTVTKTS